jgi:hypothetical protein
MSGSKWWKVVLSGARGKYCEIISKNFNYNKQSKQTKQNKSNQNQINLTEIDENKIERNKFGFPIFK